MEKNAHHRDPPNVNITTPNPGVHPVAAPMPPRYQEWLGYIFDHSEIGHAWCFDVDAPKFEANETEIAQLIEYTFRNAAVDLTRFSDAQVNQGIWVLTNSSCSDHACALRSDAVPLAIRLSAIDSIRVLYRNYFSHRCTPTLSHLDEQPASPLNSICYMFWDVAPISCLEGLTDETALADICFSVLADTLTIDHLACQEAAIHGFGEFQCWYPERVAAAMDGFLQTHIPDERLRAYATKARIGRIL